MWNLNDKRYLDVQFESYYAMFINPNRRIVIIKYILDVTVDLDMLDLNGHIFVFYDFPILKKPGPDRVTNIAWGALMIKM